MNSTQFAIAVHRALLVVAAVGAAATLSACGGGSTAAAPPPSASSPGAGDSEAPDAGTPQAAAGPKECKAADLALAVVSGSGAGMSHLGVNLQFTNKTQQTCTLQGSPGVSFVSGDDGQQVGDPATREPKSGAKRVTVAPGRQVTSELNITNAAVYPPGECQPVQARGLRVYAPDDTAAMYVEFPEQACSAPGKSMLSVAAIQG
jgi:Protein of unknown function (DUF4232)